jgi:hypothetical protein
MQTDLHTKYGYCELPVGLKLYRSDTGANTTDQIFFATNYIEGSIWGNDLEIWTAKKNIKVLFLLQYINRIGKGKSSLPQLYYDIYPNELEKSLDDLDIKQDLTRRDPFGRHLYNFLNIQGWFTTIEDGRTDFEICLFNKNEIENYFEISKAKDKSKLEFRESLMEINVFPTKNFYDRSKEIIWNEYPFENAKTSFKLHHSKIKRLIAGEVSQEKTLQWCEHRYYTLRLKLKI